ncbi:adenylate/guanylate cyclase domain-containing protein [Roseibium alexandrii]|uniref:Adenylate cyclase, family 3 (Some protein containing HAMP domain) n=1 Tax=Roseibium alexandrii (strain DSM 17067 / NCIMB 14079 / DFL-11) TaxID=244592 RepID=A0A5E8H4F8_ROSAD|nr:adenylate/guanylate cyclase domain-containing protein [Roseibium alexandrii]EEE46987.1 Adenylate cyclase, family 3 (some protein containing HAMP domain) [Roseibium alexandrii DFL-11]
MKASGLAVIERLRKVKWPVWLKGLASAGISSTDPYVRRRQMVVNVSALVGIADNLFHTIQNLTYAFYELMPLSIYGIIMICLFAVTSRLHRFGDNVAAIYFVLVIAAGNTFVVWSLGLESGTQAYFALGGAAFIFFGVGHWRLFAGCFCLALVLLVSTYVFAPDVGPVMPHDLAFRKQLAAQVMVNVLIISSVLIVYALTALHRAEAALAAEHERAETLIETIMPRAIADRLKKAPETRIADRHEAVTVLFADLVGFTPAARNLQPEEVVGFLDGLFRDFDHLVEEFGVEKIKTIGDAYMVVGGLHGPAHDAAVAVGHLALKMMGVIQSSEPLSGVHLNLRIGIHTGPAIAGVIGKRRFSYDVWGDAVNVASRMESHSVAGEIQVTDAFRSMAGSNFDFQERDAVEIKGVGKMQTAFLKGVKHG